MKLTMKLLVLFFGVLLLANIAYAQSPREELQQMVEQLQKSPNDNALRERIINLATSIKPTPAIPEEAREPFVMGATVLKKASDPAGASKAVDLFTQSLNIAPWFADAYYNRAIAREAASQYEPAIDDLKFYLQFKLTDTERREAQDKIYSLKAEAQLSSTKKAEADRAAIAERKKAEENSPQAKARRDQELVRSLNGARFIGETDFGGGKVVRDIYEIHGQEVHMHTEVVSNPDGRSFQVSTARRSMRYPGDTDGPPVVYALKGREFNYESWGSLFVHYEISEDGSKIRCLSRNEQGEIKDFRAQNSTEPRRVP